MADLFPPHLARRSWLAGVWLILALLIFLGLGAYQLHLPGLHYDEAKEAGLNAMQLLRGQPVTAFRDAAVQIGPWRVPLMVQDYIGALNVILAVPFLAVGGFTPVALRWLPLVIAALTLVVVWRVAWRLGGVTAASMAVLLLAVNPSFVFWSRQGIFVTNLTALLCIASLSTGLSWWQGRRQRDLWLTAFLWGLGIYAKLLFVWAIGAMVTLALVAWLLERNSPDARARWTAIRRLSTLGVASLCFVLPLVPLILFNVRTGGTLISVFGNLGNSYYGVDNSAYLANLGTRVEQIGSLLRGDHFWYLGYSYANAWAAGLSWMLIGLGLLGWVLGGRASLHRPPVFLLPLALLVVMVAQSAFTVSDLFITHYAVLLPLIPLTGGLAFDAAWRCGGGRVGAIPLRSPNERGGQRGSAGTSMLLRSALGILALFAVFAWAGNDAWTTIRYHRILAISGGYGAHSDSSAHLAAYLDEKGYTAPVVLDWGIDAPVSFLTAGRVNPVEVFGYERLDAPDAGFAGRVAGLLTDSSTVYIGPPPEKAVFRGRVEAMAELAAQDGRLWLQEAWFSQRSGDVLFVIYRAIPEG